MIDELPRSSEPLVGILTTRCGSPHCGFPVELVAARIRDASDEVLQQRFHAESKTWDRTKMLCERDHSRLLADILGVRFL